MGRVAPIGFIALLLTILPVFSSSAQTQSEDTGEWFDGDRFGFRVRVPGGFEVASPGGVGLDPVEFERLGGRGSKIQIFTFPFEPDELSESNVEQTRREISETLRDTFPNLINMRETPVTHRGYPGLEVMASMDSTGGFYHIIVYSVITTDRLYMIAGSSFESSFLRDLPLFRETMASFEIQSQTHGVVLPSIGNALVPVPFLMGSLLAIAVGGVVIRRLAIGRLVAEGRWPLGREE